MISELTNAPEPSSDSWADISHPSWHITSKLADCSQTDTSQVRWLSKVYQMNLLFTLSSDCSNPMCCCVHCALEANTPNTRTSHQFRYLVYPTCNCIVKAEHDKHRQNWTWVSQIVFPFSKFLSSNSARNISKLMSVTGTEERILCFFSKLCLLHGLKIGMTCCKLPDLLIWGALISIATGAQVGSNNNNNYRVCQP